MTIYILHENTKIVGKGFVEYVPTQNQQVEIIEYDENDPPEWIILRKDEIYWENGVKIKTENQVKEELLKTVQRETLLLLKDVNNAITIQTTTNIIREKNGKTPIYTISENEIEALGEYQNTVAVFHETWDPNNYTIEQINIGIFNGGVPEIPAIIARLIT